MLKIHAVRDGEWAPAEELKEVGLQAIREEKGLAIDVDGIAHLDASVLQVFLAIQSEQKKAGCTLHFVGVSADLHKWFQYAGAAALLPVIAQN